MKTALTRPALFRAPRLVRSSLATGLLFLVALSSARADDAPVGELTVVSSTVHNGYQREKLPDGSLKPVRYAFGEGTFDPGSVADASLDRVKFGQLATLLSAPLAKLGFHPSPDAKEIDQLLVIHWGRTIGWDTKGFGDAYGNLNQAHTAMKDAFPTITPDMKTDFGAPRTLGLGGAPGAASEMENLMFMLQKQQEVRARSNLRNALLLGYYGTLEKTPSFWGNMVSAGRELLIGELEDDRYYVIVAAYDFQAATKQRDRKILWITRFSLDAHGNDFDRSVNRMVKAAASYFGRSSDGLQRARMPNGRAIPGKLEVINYEEPTK
jgi:hypothetical protein